MLELSKFKGVTKRWYEDGKYCFGSEIFGHESQSEVTTQGCFVTIEIDFPLCNT